MHYCQALVIHHDHDWQAARNQQDYQQSRRREKQANNKQFSRQVAATKREIKK